MFKMQLPGGRKIGIPERRFEGVVKADTWTVTVAEKNIGDKS